MRPATVRLAVFLLYAAAAAQLLNLILNIVYLSAIREGAQKAAEAVAGTSLDNQMGGQIGGQIAAIVIGVLQVSVFVVLAILVGRGSRVGRILTWVFGGLAVCCAGAGFGLLQFGRAAFDQARKEDSSLPTWDQYNDLLYSELPGWFQPATLVIGLISALAVLGAIIALALPSSHPYFRKRTEPQWEPPLPPTQS